MKTLLPLLLFALVSNIASAQAPGPTKCMDKDGQILITDEPCSTYKKSPTAENKPFAEVPALPTPQKTAPPSNSTSPTPQSGKPAAQAERKSSYTGN